MAPDAVLWLLALIAGVGGACYWAGWRAAASYLTAARAVTEVSNAAVAQSNDYAMALDKINGSLASFKDAVQANTRTLEERNRAVEDALTILFQGFERAGFVRSSRPTPRQVGDPPSEP